MKRIGILGSTGSIGLNALNVIRQHPERFSVSYLAANENVEKLAEQLHEFQPEYAVIGNLQKLDYLKELTRESKTKLLAGYDEVIQLAGNQDTDIALNAIVGSKGLLPTLAALKAGIDVALSNKESLVMAGDIVNAIRAESGAKLFPVDSEHSAIWQCLSGEKPEDVAGLIITGSGGPFRTRPAAEFPDITVEEALKHPNWSMGAKITIDSATMMNKGLEVIEAWHLFHIPLADTEILIHPQSIIHSLVRFKDGSVKAQLGLPDMKIPIQYALTYPEHMGPGWGKLDLAALGQLSFFPPDDEKFPALKLAFQAIEAGGSYPAVLNVANEHAVYAFLRRNIRFTDIVALVNEALERHQPILNPTVEEILAIEAEISDFIIKKEMNL